MRKGLVILSLLCAFLLLNSKVEAGWVNGYYRSNGTYVNGYYRTEPNYYKYDNYSFNNNWNDIYNDKSWYRDYGYDPEPYDYDYPSYNNWNSYSNNYSSSYSNYDSYWDY